jgi:phage-related protein
MVDVFRQVPSPAYAQEELFKLYHLYALIGGMPEAVAEYVRTRDVVAVNRIYKNLFAAYIDDIPKYARKESAAKMLRFCIWMGDSRDNLRAFPEEVKDVMGFALRQAQQGGKHPCAKPLKGFKGAGVLEVVENHDGDTFRAVYTVRIKDKVYVLHVFQKKSKKGIQTPQKEMDVIKVRLKRAELEEGV